MFNGFLKRNRAVIFEILIICVLVIVNSAIFSGHYRTLFVDRGREILIPLSILDGEVLYKSILTIYSPLSYFINAVGMFIFGKNISSFYILGTFNGCIFLSIFYFLCREFLNKFLSWIIVLTVLYGCICTDGIVNYVFGHSFGMTYGLTAYLVAVFCGLKYMKNSNIKLLFLSAFFSGAAVCFKIDFFPIVLITFIPAFYNKIGIKNILTMFLFLLTIPISVFLILFAQGLTIGELAESARFIVDFAKTESMRNFYMQVGALPNFSLVKIFRYIFYCAEVFISCLLLYLGLFFSKKANSKIPIVVFGIFSVLFLMFFAEPYYHFVFFPYILICIFLVKFSQIVKEKELFFIVIAAIGLLIRVWADLRMNFYGIYVLPWVYLTLALIILRFCSYLKIFSKVKIEQFLILFFSIHCIYYFASDFAARKINSYPVKTDRGTIYVSKYIAENSNLLIDFIRENTSETDKILVLPEGQMINFLSGRKTDMHIHMLDRLYYDALGAEKVLNLLKKSEFDYIVAVKGFGLDDFGKPYLYSEKNPVTEYIFQNYELIKTIGGKNNLIEVKKKRN